MTTFLEDLGTIYGIDDIKNIDLSDYETTGRSGNKDTEFLDVEDFNAIMEKVYSAINEEKDEADKLIYDDAATFESNS